MTTRNSKELRILEIFLILICVGLLSLLYQFQGYKIVVLNLFFLPTVITGFYLGRYHSGVLALFCVIGASIAVAMDLDSLAGDAPPLVKALALAVWGSVLGMTALLIGTLSDERDKKAQELHEAYVGVVEVLSQYLQSAHPRLKARSIRVAEISQKAAEELRLPHHQIDDIRVAALLYDIGDVEITSKVIRKAVGMLKSDASDSHTFQGKDLVSSIGSVLSGAMPLLRDQDNPAGIEQDGDSSVYRDIPIGSQVIHVARDYVSLTEGDMDKPMISSSEAFKTLREDSLAGYNSSVLAAFERVMEKDSARGAEKDPLAVESLSAASMEN